MKRYMWAGALVLGMLLGVAGFYFPRLITVETITPLWIQSNPGPTRSSAATTLAFVGDIMLARDVEKRLSVQSAGYVLAGMGDLLEADMVVGNFEAAIPETHEPTPNMVLRFSVLPRLAAELFTAGFTHLSLANNHAFDFGSGGYAHTLKVLGELGFKVAGSPNAVTNASVIVERVNDHRIVLLNINATYRYPSIEEVTSVLPMTEASDMVIAYIHWGEEYELVHSAAQEGFARALIDNGIDLIIGHHPHVVQDIEQYQNGLIIYSLGNFIFDQYWNDDVQTGLLARLTIKGQEGTIDLVPVESKTVHAQPRPMINGSRSRFLHELADRSSEDLRADIAKGAISLQF